MEVIGLVLLVYIARGGLNPWESLVLFILATLDGLCMLYRHLTGRPIPKFLAVGQGLLAVSGFVLLLTFAYSR